jgi:predicted SAM-dependent methyltransferase
MRIKRIDDYKNSRGEIWLNVASSNRVLKDFINLDNHIFLFFLKPLILFRRFFPAKHRRIIDLYREVRGQASLIRHNCRTSLPFPDNSVSHILCSHFLEHIYPVEMDSLLRDFYRVLKINGTLHTIVPDLNIRARQYLAGVEIGDPQSADNFIRSTVLSRESRGSFRYRLLEFSGGFGLQHRWMYDYPSLAAKLRNVGFEILEGNETPSKLYRIDDDSVHVVARKR